MCPSNPMRDGTDVWLHVKQTRSIEERQNPMNQKNGQDQDRMYIRDVITICIIILIPSWTVAWLTDKVIYVIPMLAVCTFVTAQLFQNRSKRLDKEDLGKKKHEEESNNHHDGMHSGDH